MCVLMPMCVHAHVCVQACTLLHRGQRTTSRAGFSPSSVGSGHPTQAVRFAEEAKH